MRKKILASLIIMVLAMASFVPATVSANTYVKSGYACRSGSNIYFAFASARKNTPIYKFNVKTGRRTRIYPKGQTSLSKFENINVLGKYIYCSARPINSLGCSYIYKINIKTSKARRLAKGTKPTLFGDKIVFEGVKAQKVNDNLALTYVPSGQSYAIPQSGGKKQPVNHNELSVETACRGKKIAYGKYRFYISKNGKKIFRKNGSKKKQICRAKKIIGFRVLDGYLIVKTKKGRNNYAYCVKNNGSKSMKILKW